MVIPRWQPRSAVSLVLDTWAENLASVLQAIKEGEVKITTRIGEMPSH